MMDSAAHTCQTRSADSKFYTSRGVPRTPRGGTGGEPAPASPGLSRCGGVPLLSQNAKTLRAMPQNERSVATPLPGRLLVAAGALWVTCAVPGYGYKRAPLDMAAAVSWEQRLPRRTVSPLSSTL